MTLIVSLKVHEGIVLAADSASSMVFRHPDGRSDVRNVYNNANKVFNLYKGLPIGALTWGDGSIGEASISTLTKDFRLRIGTSGDNLVIDPLSYTIEEIASKYALFMQEAYAGYYVGVAQPQGTATGFNVAGYSSGGQKGELFQIILQDGQVTGPVPVPEFPAISLAGQPEAAQRLIFGVSPSLPEVLRDNLGVPEDQIEPVMQVIVPALYQRLDSPAMPIQDAIDLAEFLVDLTIRYTRFVEGAQTVGGPIEIATITKHEGFKWIRRKYYYEQRLNPT